MRKNKWILAGAALLLVFGIALLTDPTDRAPSKEFSQESRTNTGVALAAPETGEALLLTIDPRHSSALYRVREQFVNVQVPVDAVGTTQSVSGTVAINADGSVIQESTSISVNLATLRSDQSRRDNFIKNNTLQTQRYPEARFVPTDVKGLPFPLPHEGSADVTIAGLMTIRDVTRPVQWQGTAHFTPDGMRVTAATVITFEEFGISKPRVALVLSVADEIRLEADIYLLKTS